MKDVIILILIVGSLILGIVGGFFIAKLYNWRQKKKEIKNAKDFLAGKRKNEIEIEGQTFPAEKFRLRMDDNREIILDLKGGKVKYADKEEKTSEKGEKTRENHSSFRENSRSSGEKKRNTRRGNIRRRFG